MKNKVLKITAALLFLLPHAGLDNNRFPVMLFLFYICSFVFFRNDMERNERRLEQKQPHLFYCLRHCPEPFFTVCLRKYIWNLSFIYDGGTMDIVLLFLCRTVPAREKQTLPCLGSHSDCRSGNRFGNRPVHRSTGE